MRLAYLSFDVEHVFHKVLNPHELSDNPWLMGTGQFVFAGSIVRAAQRALHVRVGK